MVRLNTLNIKKIYIKNRFESQISKYSLFDSSLYKLTNAIQRKNYLLNLENFKYLLRIKKKNSKLYLQATRNKQIGTLATDIFRTLTGGTLYYDYPSLLKCNQLNKTIFYLDRNKLTNNYKFISSYIELSYG